MPEILNSGTLSYDPASLPRELKRHYIAASQADLDSMLKEVKADRLEDLFSHIPESDLFSNFSDLPEELSYEGAMKRLEEIASRNKLQESFIGDGLGDFEEHEIVAFVSGLRRLTTAYTPYQPERSQGTLLSLWIYQCLMAQLTGFEAINSSLYDRSTALFEALCVALRLNRKADTALIPEALFPGDMEVLETLIRDTDLNIVKIPLDPATGQIPLEALEREARNLDKRLAAIVFPQVNSLGILEDVDALADLSREMGAKSIAVIDPALLGTGGLKPPSQFGQEGVDMIVGEGQHLAIGPNFGGPGLGIFGIRFNEKVKNEVRHTPGRFVGKAVDAKGRNCHVMVLSTREQHIRKEKATSNICSNQAFLATLAGAALLARGENGMSEVCRCARQQAKDVAKELTRIPGVNLAFSESPFFNEFTLSLPSDTATLIDQGRKEGLHIGVDVSGRMTGNRHLLKISLSDKKRNCEKLIEFFERQFGSRDSKSSALPPIPDNLKRAQPAGLPQFSVEEIKRYYLKMGELNVSPDDACYPLGSCTMKYNPYLNDWAAGLKGFTGVHPQAPLEDAQGCLEILFEIQEWFKAITGLPAVTTQPVAGAQGELTGLKLFRAYHEDRGDKGRDVVLIPKTAHGTNFATAVMAGFGSGRASDTKGGIALLDADRKGMIDRTDLTEKIAQFGPRICGIMITNPNTSGIFENHFREIADAIHEVGGLVYMDGANMNAIAGWVNLDSLGVDAVHNNLHKTWTIPHGGGGPGDAIVAVSDTLTDYLPGSLVEKRNDSFMVVKPSKSIGSFHRNWGNFAHKVRCYAYLLRLGNKGICRMSAIAVLASRYLHEKLNTVYPTLPKEAADAPRMHEFILTLADSDFETLEKAGIPRALAVTRLGKLFLDFGFHAPTVAWPEALGVMIEPTESYTKAELDRFEEAVRYILKVVREKPEALNETPFFTPIDRVDEVSANRNLILSESLQTLPELPQNRIAPEKLARMSVAEIFQKIISRS